MFRILKFVFCCALKSFIMLDHPSILRTLFAPYICCALMRILLSPLQNKNLVVQCHLLSKLALKSIMSFVSVNIFLVCYLVYRVLFFLLPSCNYVSNLLWVNLFSHFTGFFLEIVFFLPR